MSTGMRLILILLFFPVIIYGYTFKITTAKNSSMNSTDQYYTIYITELIKSAVLSKGGGVKDIVSNNGVVVDSSYITNGTEMILTISFINNKGKLIDSVRKIISDKNTLPDDIRLLISQLYVSLEKPVKNLKMTHKEKSIVSSVIKNNTTEYLLSIEGGFVYSGMNFIKESSEPKYDFDCTSPNNTFRDTFMPSFRFDFKIRNHSEYHGFFTDFYIPLLIEYDRFFSLSQFRAGYSYTMNSLFSISGGLETFMLSYGKFSKYKVINSNVFLFTPGLTFDFSVSLTDDRIRLVGGLTFYPPFQLLTLNTNALTYLNFFFVKTNSTYYKNNYLFPVSPRFGIYGFTKKKDLGFFIQYSLHVLHVNYQIQVETSKFYHFFGSDYPLIHELKTGFVISKTLK